MHGASTALSDLDSAIRSLELQTNPSLSGGGGASDTEREQARQCDCMATRHPLLSVAPNCLRCGKIICIKQGLGPCTFCGTPLLPPDELQKVLRVLKDERGEARMQANNAAHRRADGTFGGYSLLFVPHGTDYGWQDDTLVMPEHRGHRLGAALKTANYADLPDDVRLVHTWTAPSNTAMHRTNTALGFRVVEHMYEVEAPIA